MGISGTDTKEHKVFTVLTLEAVKLIVLTIVGGEEITIAGVVTVTLASVMVMFGVNSLHPLLPLLSVLTT
jgi:hypothetical protein